MLSLKSIFKNHFASDRISDHRLKKFSEDHLARITADTSGTLKNLIPDTGAAYTAYFGAISDEDVASAVREGLTLSVNVQLDRFKELVKRKASTIESAFGKDSAEYQEFFPRGLSEYSQATKENVETLMLRMVAAATKHSAAAGISDVMLNFQATHSKYQQLRTAQLAQKGTVSDGKDDTSENRAALEAQLTANLHFIGFSYPTDVQKCTSFFDQSILQDERETTDEDAPPPPPAPAP